MNTLMMGMLVATLRPCAAAMTWQSQHEPRCSQLDRATYWYRAISQEDMLAAGLPESVVDLQWQMYRYIEEFG